MKFLVKQTFYLCYVSHAYIAYEALLPTLSKALKVAKQFHQ